MKVVAFVPRRSDGGHRDATWRWVANRWATAHPGVGLWEGHHDDGPFNRSLAVNRAAEAAGDWDVAVVADSDSFVGDDQLRAAVETAWSSGQITFAFSRFRYLSRGMTRSVMDGFVGDWLPGVEWTMANTCSSQVVVPRGLWDEVRGFDPGFVGWGMEDVAFSLACQSLGGGMQRVDGDVWHLWHPPSTDSTPLREANTERMRRYEACRYDPGCMRSLISELRDDS